MATAPRAAIEARRACVARAASLALPSRRWVSTDKALLTTEVLTKKIEAGLGKDTQGRPLRIDVEAKKVSTSAGPLPLSPILDPAWIQSRRRVKKDRAGKPKGRFRKKLAINPFARALETPLRRCVNVDVILPRYFLQDFEMVKHPETGVAWWAPGPLSFEIPKPSPPWSKRLTDSEDGYEDQEGQDDAHDTHDDAYDTRDDATTDLKTAESGTDQAAPESSEPSRPYRGVTCYVLCRKSMLDLFDAPKNKKLAAVLGSSRTGMSITNDTSKCVWRQGMGNVLLDMWRHTAVDDLIARTCLSRDQDPHRFVEPCSSWDQVANVPSRGCVLWLPSQDTKTHTYATVDIADALYGCKMPVHNLWSLFGDAEVLRLMQSSTMFAKNDILVLRQWNSLNMRQLHLLLWRLHGYLWPGATQT